jgi:hypothetical protein
METVLDSFVRDTEEALRYLRLSLSGDQHALREETQSNLCTFMYLLGRQLVHVPGTQLPEIADKLVIDAARHAGNDILRKVGDEQTRLLQKCIRAFKDPDDYHYAEDVACSLVEELAAHWYVQKALEAYASAAEEDSDERDRLDRAAADYRTVAKIYEDGLTGNPDGVKALSWVAHNTHYVSNLRAMLPEGTDAPWFFDVNKYRQ